MAILALCALGASGAVAGPARAAVPTDCGGSDAPDRVITGRFDSSRQGSFVLLPFEVPQRTTEVRVRYCYDQPEKPTGGQSQHTLDLGLYEPRRDGRGIWGVEEFRGWSGSGLSEVAVTPQGFSGEARYEADPDAYVPGRTSRSYRPGPSPPGDWAVELGLANIASRAEGDETGEVGYRVEILLDDNPKFTENPYRRPGFDPRPARTGADWYAGDFHVHAEHSGDAEATMNETFDYAFRSLERGGAGLDFIALSDHNTDSAWPEIARRRDDHPNDLVIRSQEVTTYRGHANNHASGEHVDYRTGPLLVRARDGSLRLLRGRQPARRFLAAIDGSGGFTQINHPTLFPSPPFPANLCRGCEWEYSPRQTDYDLVDAIEVATGPADVNGPTRPGPNPFTVTAIEFWEDKLDAGHKIAAVGGSDDHRGGEPEEPTQSPVGEPTTVVFAEELSQRGVRAAVKAGHSYVKVSGNDAPDLRFTARAPGSSAPAAIMGDTVRGEQVEFVARVLGGGPGSGPGGPYQLTVLKDGKTPVRTAPVTSDDFRLAFRSLGPGRYRLHLTRGTSIEGVSSPIYVKAAAGGGGPGGGGDEDRDGTGGQDGDGTSTGTGREGSRASGGRGTGRRGGREAADEQPLATAGAGSDTGDEADAANDAGGALPFTGLALGVLIALGAALVGAGAVARRGAR